MRAIRMATWNAADYWRLEGIGAIAPGYSANLVILRDLERVEVAATWYEGRLVASDGHYLGGDHQTVIPDHLRRSVNVAPILLRDLSLQPDHARQAVGVIPGQIVTRLLEVEPRVVNGLAVSDMGRDMLKLICIERHHATGRTGVGYVQGFGLQRGAIASAGGRK